MKINYIYLQYAVYLNRLYELTKYYALFQLGQGEIVFLSFPWSKPTSKTLLVKEFFLVRQL